MKANRKLAKGRLSVTIAAAIAASSAANAFDVPVHVRMTKTVVESLSANVAGADRKFSDKAVGEIADANESVDSILKMSAALWHPERHFTNEKYSASSQLLIKLRAEVIASAKDGKGSKARQALGKATHTIQDYYSHSNFNERAAYVEGGLGTAVLADPSLSSAPCPDDPNVAGTNFAASATSLYFVGLGSPTKTGCFTSLLPENKCFHGNYTPSCPGLNKDLDATGAAQHHVTQHPLHAAAAQSAQHSTRMFIEGILAELAGDDKALSALLDVKGDVAVVLDNTGSMGSTLNGTKAAISAIVAANASDPTLAPESYILQVYGDPYMGTPLVTNDLATFQAALGSVGAAGGGDCPELAQTGLLRAIDAASPGSRVMLYTDATSKDGYATNQVIQNAQAKGASLIYNLTGSCSPTDPNYIRGAAETGGQVFRLSPYEIPLMVDFLLPQIKSKMGTIARQRIDLGAAGSHSMDLPIDSSMQDLLISVSVAENNVASHQDVRLIRPNGATVSGSDPGVKIVALSYGLVAYVEAPEPGLWKLETEGYGPYTAIAQGNGPIDLARFDFVEPNQDIHGGFEAVAGQPVAGSSGLGQASLVGPVASATFNLIDESGAVLGPVSLEQNFPAANPSKYLGEVALPTTPFRVQVTGVDEDGVAYQRQYPAVYRAQPLQVQTSGFPVVTLVPAEPQQVRYTVKNLGAPGIFNMQASDAHGYAQNSNPSVVELATDEQIEVVVTVMAPANAADGDESLITFTATRKDSPTTYNSATTLATVEANQAPVCVAKPALQVWPPNGNFASVNLDLVAGVTDPDGDSVVLSITGITQDEPVSGPGSGNTRPDAGGVGSAIAQVRSERDGNGNGRVYAIQYLATDSKGATCAGSFNIGVPHAQDGAAAIDDGQDYSSIP